MRITGGCHCSAIRYQVEGDLIVHARLVLPQAVDERSRELMREFGRRNNDNVRKDLIT